MKFLVVVLFATMAGDIYVFTEPKFDTREECIKTLKTPDTIVAYTQKLIMAYGKPMPIRLINCLQEDTIKELLQDAYKEEKGVGI